MGETPAPKVDAAACVLQLNNDVWYDGRGKVLTEPRVSEARFGGSAASHIGLVKKCNEDACIIDNRKGIYIVCDGLGGHAAGEVASNMAATAAYIHIVEQMKVRPEIFAKPTEQDAINLITGAVGAANGAVWGVAQEQPKSQGMATTVVMVVMMGTHAVVAHVGDSRVYLLRQGECVRLTDDHTIMAAMSKWAFSPNSTIPRRGLGGQMTRAIGFYQSVQVDVLFVELADDDRFILTTDGLTDMIDEKQLMEVATETSVDQLPQLPLRYVGLANENGGKDNTTVALAHFKPTDPPSRIAIRKVQVLEKVPLFAQLGYVERLRLLNCAWGLGYKKGDVIVKQGDTDQKLYIILTGAVDVMRDGRKVAELGEMEFFGEMSLVDGEPRSADVVGQKDGGMLVFSRESIESLLQVEPGLAVRVLWPLCQLISQRLRKTSEQLAAKQGPGG